MRHHAQGNLPARHRDAGQTTCVRGTVADLAIDLTTGRRRRQDHGGDQFAGLQAGFDFRRLTGQPVKHQHGECSRLPGRHQGLDVGTKRRQRHRHVRGVGGNAVVGRAKDRRIAVQPLQRTAPGSGRAFVAGFAGVVEIGAAGSLQQVAAHAGLVAQLRRTTGHNRLREHRIAGADLRVRGHSAVGRRRTDPQASVERRLDGRHIQAADVDQMRGGLDFELHKVQQIGAAGDEPCAWRRRRGLYRRLGITGAFVGERPHAITFAASLIAATIWG